jgi:V/A-type H+/Na+-transporting ATPase subunit D
MPARPPPGRAGRVWLAERVAVARSAVDLLEHKQQLLRREHLRLTELAERTGSDWQRRAAEADAWNARALVSGGRDDLRRAAATVGVARASLEWTSEAGATYPSATAVDFPPPPMLAGTPALRYAATASRRALDAAVRHAAATTACATVDAELIATVRRLRAIRDRWLPQLQSQLTALDLRLDETEREEVTRLRWGDRRPPTPTETKP